MNLHLNFNYSFPEDDVFPEFPLPPPVFDKFMLIYELVSKCLIRACGMLSWSEVLSGTCLTNIL